MIYRNRWNAIEGETVRLYFRNYVGNVLQDVATLPVCQIRPRGSTQVLATPPVVHESTGVYYVEWAIPSSSLGSLKFDPNFPGPGDYQDVWYEGSSILVAQDFYVASEDRTLTLAKIRQPLVFQYQLVPSRLEYGAKDYVTLQITEQNGQILDVWPGAQWRLWRGDTLLTNYSDTLHKSNEPLYRLYLDTTQYAPGLYKLQFKWEIPEETADYPAQIIGTKNLAANGYNPDGVGVLRMNIDGIIRSIDFPSTATPPSVESTPPPALNFVTAANDILYINVDGTDRLIRLPRTSATQIRTIAELAAELNDGTPPAFFSSSGITFPIVTSYLDHSTPPAGIDGTSLILDLDGTTVTVVFNSITTVSDITAQINTAVGTNIATVKDDIIILHGAGVYNKVAIQGGTSVDLLGFQVGQADDASTHRLDNLGVTVTASGSALTFTGSNPAGYIKFYAASDGSIANTTIGIDGNGLTVYGSTAQPAIIQSDSLVAPFVVEHPANAVARSSAPLVTHYALNNGSNVWQTDLDGTSFTYDDANNAPITVTFNDIKNNAAIVSPKASSTFSFPSNTQLVVSDGTNVSTASFSAGTTYTTADVVAVLNSAFAAASANLIADSYNGLIRISSTTTSGSVIINVDSASDSAYVVLGFSDVLYALNKPYQNDQVYLDTSTTPDTLVADPYVLDWTPNDILSHINSTISGSDGTASLDNGYLVIEATSNFDLITGAPDALPKLNLSAGTYYTKAGQNYELSFNVTVGANNYNETVTLSPDQIKTVDDVVVDINSVATLVTASNVNDRLVIETIYKGSTVSLTVSDGGSGTLNALNITTTSDVGADATVASYTTSSISSPNFFAGDNAYLVITYIDGSATYTAIIDLNSANDPTDVALLINSNPTINPWLTASYTNGILKIVGNTPGSNKSIIIGSINDGSTANSSLRFPLDGATAFGTDGTPYSLESIIYKINAAYGGYAVAQQSGNRIKLQSIDSGGGAKIEILAGTTNDVIQQFGFTEFLAYGDTETRLSQVIVSPKLTFVIGE